MPSGKLTSEAYPSESEGGGGEGEHVGGVVPGALRTRSKQGCVAARDIGVVEHVELPRESPPARHMHPLECASHGLRHRHRHSPATHYTSSLGFGTHVERVSMCATGGIFVLWSVLGDEIIA